MCKVSVFHGQKINRRDPFLSLTMAIALPNYAPGTCRACHLQAYCQKQFHATELKTHTQEQDSGRQC